MSFSPLNALVSPLLTDQYQLTMAYAYYRNGTHNQHAVFDLFFRRAPFGGDFAVFAGLEEALRFVASFRFTAAEVAYVRSLMPHADAAFFDWLAALDSSHVRIDAIDEGSVVHGRVPLLRVQGPLAVCQLLETTLLVLINFATLVATNAARLCLAAKGARIVEFGLRRAQGPDGGVSASRYAYLGGAWGTSNLAAGRLLGVPVTGTHAHAFVTSFTGHDELQLRSLAPAAGGEPVDFVALVQHCRAELGFALTNSGELQAFTAYALAFPDALLALVDTYDTLASGVPNFLTVALALHRLGRRAVGIRLDSGDLAALSKAARQQFRDVGARVDAAYFGSFSIVASNDLNEASLVALEKQGHSIDVFGVGTQLATCSSCPALGGVYKLVEIGGQPRMKLSEDIGKASMPARKVAFRLLSGAGAAFDLLQLEDEAAPRAGERVLCVHPFESHKRTYVTPTSVERLHHVYWLGANAAAPSAADLAAAAAPSRVDVQLANGSEAAAREQLAGAATPSTSAGRVTRALPALAHVRARAVANVAARAPAQQLSVTQALHDLIRTVWLQEAPIHEQR